ncbi:MAG: YciI family protein [Chloroflexota bacterium]|nr:YciI family protein [Chloroflexota bacterium]
MAKFGLVYLGGGVSENEAERAATMQAWGAWFGGLGSALIDGGNAFTPNAKSITSNGTLSAGSGDLLVTGYSIVKADSLDAAVALAKDCPLLRSGSRGQVSVYEVDETLGI